MRTDEYCISLSRELSVCKSSIKKIESIMASMENKYKIKTEDFIEEYKEGEMSGSGDYVLWRDKYAELKMWREMEIGYKDMLSLTCL
jgi:hypothetical protein